jgi:PPK2 family polyphosphate:nucleotide phosphotransferase
MKRLKFQDLRVDEPDKFRLADIDPAGDPGLHLDKDEATGILADRTSQLADLQQRLYADRRWAVLLILQGMDASGKDGIIKHVMAGINPQGCQVHAFGPPSQEDLEHDFLWRVTQRLPERGRVGIFNRSHYEEVLVVRVRPELLARQKLPARLVGKNIWQDRFKSIREFEGTLAKNGMLVLKFFLHISREEQRRRFLARLEEPAKRWKFSMGDLTDRALWDDYMAAYEDAIRETSREEAPWFVIPADHKWLARVAVASIVVDAMEGLKLDYPKVEGEALAEMEKVRKALLAEEKTERH